MNFNKEIQTLKNSNQYRYLKDISHLNNGYINYNGKKLLNLSSNDYIGISQNTELLNLFLKNIDIEKYLFGSASSRLLSGNYKELTNLENIIAKAYNKENAVVYNSGYHANIGILPALTTKKDLILSDKLNHASIIDGLKLSTAKTVRYKHLNYNQISTYLEMNRNKYENVFIVSESIFSMNGDTIDLNELVYIKNKYNCLLYIDEAHAIGVYGYNGLGVSEKQKVIKDVDFIIGTFGKALGSIGAFVTVNNIFKELLVNKSRTLIFTTGLPLINIMWTSFIFEKLSEFKKERNELMKISKKIRLEINNLNLQTLGNTHIIPIITGENTTTIKIYEELIKQGYYISAVRPPTVPEGTSRIRLSLNSNLEYADLQLVVEIINNVNLI